MKKMENKEHTGLQEPYQDDHFLEIIDRMTELQKERGWTDEKLVWETRMSNFCTAEA